MYFLPLPHGQGWLQRELLVAFYPLTLPPAKQARMPDGPRLWKKGSLARSASKLPAAFHNTGAMDALTLERPDPAVNAMLRRCEQPQAEMRAPAQVRAGHFALEGRPEESARRIGLATAATAAGAGKGERGERAAASDVDDKPVAFAASPNAGKTLPTSPYRKERPVAPKIELNLSNRLFPAA